MESYAGKYEVEGPGILLTFAVGDEGLTIQQEDGPTLPLGVADDSTFTFSAVDATIYFHREASGEATQRATLRQSGMTLPLRRTESWAPALSDLGAFEGRYFSDELETFYTLVVEDSALVVQHRRMEDVNLNPRDIDAFGFPGGEFAFERDEDGMVTAFIISAGGTRGVRFEKRD